MGFDMTQTVFRQIAFALAALTALPAAAQDLCGGAFTGGQWIGGSEDASDMTTADSYREQMALVLSGNTHVSLFALSAPTSVRVEVAGRGNGDPALEVFDSQGVSVLSDDDSGGNGAARSESELGAGTYCVAVTSYDGSPMTAFVRIGRSEQEPLTDGISEDEGQDLGEAEAQFGAADCRDAPSLGTLTTPITASASAADTPFWRFTLDAATAVTVTAANESADPTLTLRGPDGAVLAENDDYDGLDSRVDMSVPLLAGDYCIGIGAISDETLPITVTVSEYDPEAAFADLYNAGEALPPLDGSVTITALGPLQSRLRQDVRAKNDATWFTFDVPQAGIVAIEAIGAGGAIDPWIAVYDDLGRQMGQNDDAADGLDSQLILRINAGTYMIAVKQVGAGEGFVRLLMERFVPAE